MQIALNQLKPNPQNVRTVKANNLDTLIASIKSRDLLHNLVVKKNGVGYIVIDGNRRYEALMKIHGKNSTEMIPCKVIDDNETEVGVMANMLREGMHPLDESEAISKVMADGEMTYDALAVNWGQTSKWVKQRVAFADLSDKVKAAFRNNEFGIGIAQLFTNVNQDTMDRLYDDCNGHFDYDDLQRMIGQVRILRSEVIIPEKHKLFKSIDFDGDLFTDAQYVANMAQYMPLAVQFIEEKQKYYKKIYRECVVIDTYPQEVKGLLKNKDQVYEHEIKSQELSRKDLDVVIMAIPIKGIFYVYKYRSKIDMSKKELAAIENGEIPDLTLADMSNPQLDLTNDMFYHYLRKELWEGDRIKYQSWVQSSGSHFTLALACNAITPQYHDDKHMNDTVEHYTNIKYERTGDTFDYFTTLWQEMSDYTKEHKCNSLMFFIRKQEHELAAILRKAVISCMDRSQTFKANKEIYNLSIAKNWFQPTEEWLNKYKITQLRLLANKIKCDLQPTDGKKLVMEKIIKAFENGAEFDPIRFLEEV
tara:strand:- start:5278 stop:6876 length:1599 start_codon:yes stop_codon:yes gene_type:complete